ncbi:MAG: polysaccharide pyruvyl transferase family protein [Nanoarchaeota archaeon]
MNNNILIFSGAETGNYGDIKDLEVITNQLKLNHHNFSIYGPTSIRKHSTSFINQFDLIILAGGGQFMDYLQTDSPYLPIDDLDVDIPIIIWGCGFNKDYLEKDFSNDLLSKFNMLFNNSILTGMRTLKDVELAKKYTNNVFYCPPPSSMLHKHNIKNNNYIGVSLSVHTPTCKSLFRYWKKIIENIKIDSLFQSLPPVSPDDIVLDLDKELLNQDILEAMSKCFLVISNRYHICMLALSMGIPCMVMGYNIKCDYLIENFADTLIKIKNDNIDECITKAKDIMSNVHDLSIKAKYWKINTEHNFNLFLEKICRKL